MQRESPSRVVFEDFGNATGLSTSLRPQADGRHAETSGTCSVYEDHNQGGTGPCQVLASGCIHRHHHHHQSGATLYLTVHFAAIFLGPTKTAMTPPNHHRHGIPGLGQVDADTKPVEAAPGQDPGVPTGALEERIRRQWIRSWHRPVPPATDKNCSTAASAATDTRRARHIRARRRCLA